MKTIKKIEADFNEQFVPENKTGEISMERYLSIIAGQKQFIRQSIKSLLDELVPKKYKKLETDSIEIKLHEALLEAGHKKCREELIKRITNIRK